MTNEIAKRNQGAVSHMPEDRFVRDIISQANQAKIIVPDDYAAENAVKSAYLEIVSKGYFKKCTTESVINSVLDMVVQGLNPAKDQCYFVAFSNKLKLMRSYLGSIAVSKRFDSRIAQVNYAAIYGGDKFKIEVIKAVRYVRGHEQDFANIRKDNIIGAYALALDTEGNEISSDIMTFDDIKESWRRSSKKDDTRPILDDGSLNPKSDHAKQPDRFACRTVVNRLCKALISVTDDKQLLRAIRKTDEDMLEGDVIDLDYYKDENEPSLIDIDDDEVPTEEKVSAPATDEATDDQCKMIFEIEKSAGRHEQIRQTLSSYFGREITGLKKLTIDEANRFIEFRQAPPPVSDDDGIEDTPSGPSWE